MPSPGRSAPPADLSLDKEREPKGPFCAGGLDVMQGLPVGEGNRAFCLPGQAPAIVISAILSVGAATAERHTRSLATISTDLNISFRFPAIVISSTG